jgi:hypothetical protein
MKAKYNKKKNKYTTEPFEGDEKAQGVGSLKGQSETAITKISTSKQLSNESDTITPQGVTNIIRVNTSRVIT